jgi:N-acetylglucosamine kinase-like BadF-type ATPase
MTAALVLAIDGGQSSTKALIADTAGNILGRGTGSPCDHITGPHGYERNRAAIHSATLAALADAGVTADRIVAAGMGLTSCPPELKLHHLFEEMLREIADPAHLWIDHDVASNLAGASAGAPGIVVIAGGGSIGYGVAADGREAKAGGMGYLMGDDGSAWWIGLHAIRAAAAAVDRRGPDTALLPFVLEHYDIPTIRHIVEILYGPDFTRDRVAGIAPAVVRLAENDAVAREIVTTAGELLARLAVAVAAQLFPGDSRIDVYPTGGVFRAGPLVTRPFRETLVAGRPGAVIQEPRFAPVYGALFRAYQAMDVELTDSLLANLEGGKA